MNPLLLSNIGLACDWPSFFVLKEVLSAVHPFFLWGIVQGFLFELRCSHPKPRFLSCPTVFLRIIGWLVARSRRFLRGPYRQRFVEKTGICIEQVRSPPSFLDKRVRQVSQFSLPRPRPDGATSLEPPLFPPTPRNFSRGAHQHIFDPTADCVCIGVSHPRIMPRIFFFLAQS